VSCHGVDGVGTDLGPTLVNSGAASASFYLTTGRMPAAQGTPYQPPRKQPAYNQADIDALVAYVASLGTGPAIPTVDVADADVAAGGVLYRANCASCHQSAGAGGALSYGQSAPDLKKSTPTQVVEAMRTGPGQMPVFSELASPTPRPTRSPPTSSTCAPRRPGRGRARWQRAGARGLVALTVGWAAWWPSA
jgi:ubiquinol-cytochrome c reductase cytochrome c subunit